MLGNVCLGASCDRRSMHRKRNCRCHHEPDTDRYPRHRKLRLFIDVRTHADVSTDQPPNLPAKTGKLITRNAEQPLDQSSSPVSPAHSLPRKPRPPKQAPLQKTSWDRWAVLHTAVLPSAAKAPALRQCLLPNRP